jgi:uncharacterized protein YkwD
MLPDTIGNTHKDATKIKLRSKTGVIRNHVGRNDVNDYFTFRLKKSSHVKLAVQHLRADVGLELLDQRRQIVATSSSFGKRREKIQLKGLDKGRYFVRVYQDGGQTRYRLNFSGKPIKQAPKTKAHPFVQQVLALTNAERAKAGIKPLILNAKLNSVAHAHSKSMAIDDFFSHTGADGSNPFERIEDGGYHYQRAAENIGAGYSTPESIVSAWMNSPGHRANILNADLRDIGIGYYFLNNDIGTVQYQSYWTQSFGTPFH